MWHLQRGSDTGATPKKKTLLHPDYFTLQAVEEQGRCHGSTWCLGNHALRNPPPRIISFSSPPPPPLADHNYYHVPENETCRPVLQLCGPSGNILTFRGPERLAGLRHSTWPVWDGCMEDPFYDFASSENPIITVRLGTSSTIVAAGKCLVTPAMDPFFAEFLVDYGLGRTVVTKNEEQLHPGCFKLLFCYPSRYIAYLCEVPVTSEAFDDRIEVHARLSVAENDLPPASYGRWSAGHRL
ncbi:hypothetical protein [Crucian carp herpesvirus]|uniref:ORF67 n=1 Tax=Cyprinid herpesvirus 2 TaxID=317878 RepID=A0A0Y0CEL7_CYHV2|nr:ORF67 [Cyprinid herpesvirus 2]APB92914.1 hypothetical protein [Crucian carp herpesvirus]